MSEFFGILMLDGNDGSRRAQCHGLPASLLAHIERKTEAVWKSIGDLQKAMEEAVPPAQRSGPEWGGDGELSKRFMELMKRLGDIRKLQLGSAAMGVL
jgi:hypothetical protein